MPCIRFSNVRQPFIPELRMFATRIFYIIATMNLFISDSFSDRLLQVNCKFYKYQMSVLAVGFNIIGHQVHHFGVIEERYFPLDQGV